MELEMIAKICKALGDSNRIAIMKMLSEQNLCASDILNRLDITQPTLSHHMKMLTDSGIITSRKERTMTYYSLNRDCISQIRDILNTIAPGEKQEVLSEQEENYQQKLFSVAQEARRENAAKTDFLMRMSHNLRIQITGIKGMLMVALKSEDDREHLHDCLKKMSEATEQLEEVVNEILDMNDLENDKEALVLQPFNVFDTAREINHLYAAKIEKAGLTFKSEAKGEIKHPYIMSGRVYVKRIFEIILDNAIRYNRPNGSVSVTFEEVAYTEDTTTHRVKITDTGVGMTPEAVKSILEPYMSHKAEYMDNEHGSGLGLSIVKRFLDKIDGKISLDSTIDEGTTVTIEMTFAIDKQTEQAIAHKSSTGISGARILLVEDNDLNMEVAEFILSDAGASVICAKNGEAALDVIKNSAEGEFDLILMDIVMPVMDGYETTKAIRGLDRKDTAKMPIIAMSANAFDKDILISLEAGMNAHVSKPLNVNKLITVLGQWMANHS